MYRRTIILFLIFLIFSCCSCSNETDPDYLPTFESINADENTLYFVNISNNKIHKIYAIDIKDEKKIYTYEFDRRKFTNVISDLVYDASFDINPYIIFMNGDALKLDVRSGKLVKFNIDYFAGSLAIVDNKLWITPSGPGLENTPVDYFTYNPKNNKTDYITIPGGEFFGSWGIINNNIYLSLNFEDSYSKIYNLTNDKMISKDIFEQDYYVYTFFCNNYLFAWYSSAEKADDAYFVKSFEPTIDYNYLFSTDTDELTFVTMFENNDFIYLVSREYVIKRDKKNNYNVEKIVRFNNKISFGFYCRNGYIWLTSEEDEGAYKVNMDDLSYEIIK